MPAQASGFDVHSTGTLCRYAPPSAHQTPRWANRTLAKGTTDGASWGGMMSTRSTVNVLQKLLPLIGREVPMLYSYMPLFVQVFAKEVKGLGPSMEPLRLHLILEE